MNEPLKVLKDLEREILYDLPDTALITPAMVESLIWPENIRQLRFYLSGRVFDEFEATRILSKRHPSQVVYSARQNDFNFSSQSLLPGMERLELDYAVELKTIYLETSDKYHRDSGKPLTTKGMEERSYVISSLLPASKNICVKKAGEAVALLVTLKWEDCFGHPVDWVPWVWVSSSLSALERAGVHAEFYLWLRKTVKDRVQCIVEADNLRSRKFFIKMGFHPECLVISKGN